MVAVVAVVVVVAHLLEGDAQLALGLADPLGEAVSAVPHEERNTLLPLIITATRLVRLESRPREKESPGQAKQGGPGNKTKSRAFRVGIMTGIL